MLLAAGPVNSDTQDYGAIAALYSQLAGVLAGFAFAGLVALAAAQLTSGGRASAAKNSYASLMAALIGLVATSLNYAIIAGEDKHNSRGAALETIGGLGFCVAGLMLFYSILALLAGVKKDDGGDSSMKHTVLLAKLCLTLGICPLMILLLYGGVTDQESIRYGSGTGFHWLDYAGLSFVGVSFLAGIIFTLIPGCLNADTLRSIVVGIAAVCIALALVAVAGTSIVIIFMSSDTLGPEFLAIIEMAALLAVTLGVSFTASRVEV